MKRFYLTTIIVCLLTLLGASFVYRFWDKKPENMKLVVGYLSENDEMTANTYNFFQSQNILEKVFPEQVEILTKTNVQEDETMDALDDLIHSGARILFTNTRSEKVKAAAALHPEVQFCQLSTGVAAELKTGSNFHTFNAKNYQGHYVSGVAAGMKLQQMINDGTITADQAQVGYIGSFPTAETISGFTAFILGVRSECPDAVMRVRYANALSNFSREKANAKDLIDEGCIIIAHNSGSTGPAAACQEAAVSRPVFYIGFNENMINDATTVSLIGVRNNWDPFVTNAVRAVISEKPLESVITGEIHGNDICAGFEEGWLEIIDLNENLAAPGTAAHVNEVIDQIINGKVDIFQGNYTGVDSNNMRIKIDLNDGFNENSNSSKPTFHYILKDVITVEKYSGN
ncbi:MAG: BMP family ABC transporter substrate-binding protein [Flexilinea sp.]|nr:BMP family ABC transporter substrate-binding protein [Flexilinea sp.]